MLAMSLCVLATPKRRVWGCCTAFVITSHRHLKKITTISKKVCNKIRYTLTVENNRVLRRLKNKGSAAMKITLAEKHATYHEEH